MTVRVLVLTILMLLGACTKQASTAQVLSAHAWNVYDNETLILEVNDAPGPILSTASLPPGARPATHPFLSATAKSAVHEDALHRHLVAAKTLREFLESLIASGYRVVPLDAGA